MIDKKKVAVLMLAFSDFESMEISLAAISKTIESDDFKLFILQNGRNTYDCERTYRVAKRYENLFPKNIKVVDWITPNKPYFSILEFVKSSVMEKYDYICKIDDDTFPLRKDWLDKIIDCYDKSKNKLGESLAYVTGLVNNNPWGFLETMQIFDLEDEYIKKITRSHLAGSQYDEREPLMLLEANHIYTGCCGTIWRNPYIARWLHEKTSFVPQEFIDKTKSLEYKEVDETKRYSINVIMFEKIFWKEIYLKNNSDDEHMCREYCIENNKKIMADLSNPFVHINFFSQREENRDLLLKFRKVYEDWLQLPYPISMCPNKDYENENRLRYIEEKIRGSSNSNL